MRVVIGITLAMVLIGCSYTYNQFNSLVSGFIQGCEYKTINSSLTTEGNSLTLIANCQKAK